MKPCLVEAGTQTDLSMLLMCDGETQVEKTVTSCVGNQWPEYEQNTVAEPDKCSLDHSYNAILPIHSTPQKSLEDNVPPPTEHMLVSDAEDVITDDVNLDSCDTSDDSFVLESEESASGSDMSTDSPQPEVSDIKFITFKSCVLELCGMVCCPTCGQSMMVTDTNMQGSCMRISLLCPNSHDYVWRSQPLVNKMVLGNLLIAAAIMFSGNTFSRMQQFAHFLNLGFPSESTYLAIQHKYLCPVINEAWLLERRVILDNFNVESLVVSGDGRCDSPGFCAKYCTYTLMELDTRQIVDFKVIHVAEASSSVGMEKVGLERCIQSLKDDGFSLETLATDRHVQITSHIRNTHPCIQHQYDVWHMSKWLSKKLSAAGKKAQCQSVAKWSKSICNHLWWSAANCDGNPDILKESFVSIIHHVCNVHVFPGNYITSCSHSRLEPTEERQTKWLKLESKAYKAITQVVLNKRFLNDIGKLTLFCHTGDLESYHSLITKYCPKRQHFGMEGMIARTQLAALDYSHNVNRKQAVIKGGKDKGQLRYRSVCTKHNKQWVLKPVMENKQYPHIPPMIERVVELKTASETLESAQLPILPANLAPVPRPSKSELLERQRSRFKK